MAKTFNVIFTSVQSIFVLLERVYVNLYKNEKYYYKFSKFYEILIASWTYSIHIYITNFEYESMRSMTLLAIVAIIALGTAATASAIIYIPTAQAKSCNQFDFGFDCNGCAFLNQGYLSSGGKCHHDR